MTPRDSDLSHASRSRVRPSARAFTQGNVTEGPRSRSHRDNLSDRRMRDNAPVPLQSLVASAKRLTKKKLTGGSFKKTTAQGWQEDAWEMYDLVGEQHFLGSTLANQASKARFYVGSLGEGGDITDMPEPSDDAQLQAILEVVGGGAVGFAQMVQRMLVNLWVAGDGWLVGIPKQLLPDYEPEDEAEAEELLEWDPTAIEDPNQDATLSMGDLEWRMLSVSEVSLRKEGLVQLHLGGDASEKIEVSPNLLYMIRVWRPHPRRWWEADSPTRSSLPVLRELVGLTMHISAQVDSRLAGAGLLLVPASAARALKLAAGLAEDSAEDPFTDALMEAMLTPIGDRANASALVPLVVTVPDGTAQDFQFITFAKPLDTEARNLRDEAIRRLALGQDAPPELLLGTGGMNHWGAWLVRDDVVTTHIEPPLALIADALTTQYLRPMMAELGYPLEVIKRTVIWYDTSKMIVQPNRAADALTLYDRDALSDESLREANGFDETDAPETSKMDLASQKAFIMVQENPGLMANPGLPMLVEQMRALIAGNPIPLPKKGASSDVAAPVNPATGEPIATTNSTPQPGGATGAPGGVQPAESQVNQGAPPRNPSVKQGPALGAVTETFNSFDGYEAPERVSDEEYARQLPHGGWDLSDKALWHVQVTSTFEATSPEFRQTFDAHETEEGTDVTAGAPGLNKDGTPPKCHYCEQEATGWFLFAEGMAFIPFCEKDRDDAYTDAVMATPSGEADPSNIDLEGAYSAPDDAKLSIVQDLAEDMREEHGDDPSNPFVKGFLKEADRQAARDGYDASHTSMVDDQSDLTEGTEVVAPSEVVEDQVDDNPAMVGAIVVLIPAESDLIHQASTDIDAHLTLAYLANDITTEPMPPTEVILEQAKAVASSFGETFLSLDKDQVMPLGDAVVLSLQMSDELRLLQDDLVKPGSPIGSLDAARNSYEFRPHVSLTYVEQGDPAEVAQGLEYPHPVVMFDRIGVWIGETHYDFQLGVGAENQPPAEQSPAQEPVTAVDPKLARVPESASVVRSPAEMRAEQTLATTAH